MSQFQIQEDIWIILLTAYGLDCVIIDNIMNVNNQVEAGS
jgi:hypothetical protein